jgi:transcriptional regulator with XRE-family HTH domain
VEPEIAFGRVLQRHRRAKGLSQERLAVVSRLDRTFISLLERGQRQPSLSTLLRVAKALDVSAADLVSQVEELQVAGGETEQT